jgi:hypothetical protein
LAGPDPIGDPPLFDLETDERKCRLRLRRTWDGREVRLKLKSAEGV